METLYDLSSYQFELPDELIAQRPASPRDSSRLMLVDRKSGTIEERKFYEIAELLKKEDSLVFNETKVIPARLEGRRASGGKTEIFLVKPLDSGSWEVMARPGKKLRTGASVAFSERFGCRLTEKRESGLWRADFFGSGPFEKLLAEHGKTPLPPYIKREGDEDRESYQTVYAKNPGAVAAPTAGLHFTPELLERLGEQGVGRHKLTLHVGMGTFSPVVNEDIRKHRMHSEQYIIDAATAEALNRRPPGSRRIAVGTTCCRALESALSPEGEILPGNYQTNIFIYPGYRFKYVEALLTNFHLPGSTLLMLVSAFAGYDLMMEAYKKAVKERFRFFSYGDAMLIL